MMTLQPHSCTLISSSVFINSCLIISVEMSFIPLDHAGIPSASGRTGEATNTTEEVIPAKRVALTDILPLTLVGDQVMMIVMMMMIMMIMIR